jgi:hypothetical protein
LVSACASSVMNRQRGRRGIGGGSTLANRVPWGGTQGYPDRLGWQILPSPWSVTPGGGQT